MLSVTRTTWVLRRLLNKALFTRRPSFPCARDISGPRDTDSSSMSCGSHCTRIFFKIKLSSYQHLCCIVSLIASSCSIKSPIFAVFIHISPCLFRFSICQLIIRFGSVENPKTSFISNLHNLSRWYLPTSKYGSSRVPVILRAPGDNLKVISHPFFLWLSLRVCSILLQRSYR